MPFHLLAASESSYRRWWYVAQLPLYGLRVTAAMDGVDCVRQMRTAKPDVVLLEPSLLWGGSRGVLAIRAEELELRNIPVVLIATSRVAVEWYQLTHYSIQGLLVRRPSGQKLAAMLISVLDHAWAEN